MDSCRDIDRQPQHNTTFISIDEYSPDYVREFNNDTDFSTSWPTKTVNKTPFIYSSINNIMCNKL